MTAPGAPMAPYPPPQRPTREPLAITGEYEGATGHWWHLSTGSSVKYSVAAHAYVCLAHDCIATRQTSDCAHVRFVRDRDEHGAEREAVSAAERSTAHDPQTLQDEHSPLP